MRILLFFLALSFSIFSMGQSVYAQGANTESIAVVVNEDAITYSDVSDRMRLIMISSGMPNNPDIINKLKPQVINVLVEEQIKLQEAERLGIEVTQDEINDGFKQLAQQNNAPADQFREMVMRSGVNIATMDRQIKSQLAWAKVVQQTVRPQIIVSDADIDDALSRVKNNVGQYEYRVAEIYLPIEDPKGAGNVLSLANSVSQDIQAGRAPFFKVAQQLSKSAGAAQGGDLGWVQEGQIGEELERVLVTMEPETVSDPVKSPTGYHILYLLEKRQITEDTLPSREGMMSTIGMQRLERQQRRLLQDLKSSAYIDTRV